jgi:hypothetical protein
MNKEDEHSELADVTEPADFHGLGKVSAKDEANCNCAEDVEIREVAKIIHGIGRGARRKAGAGSGRDRDFVNCIGLELVWYGMHELGATWTRSLNQR